VKGSKFIWLGLALTVIFGVFCLWLGSQQVCEITKDGQSFCQSNFKAFLESPPNEKGDALAGVAGSLAFLWIIITVLLQSNELSLQREELAQTRNTLEKQTSYLAAQEGERVSLSVDKLIMTKFDTLEKLKHVPSFEAFDAVDSYNNQLLRKHMAWITNKRRKLGLSNSELISSLKSFIKNSKNLREKEIYLVRPDLKCWTEIRDISREILELAETATPAMRDRIKRIEHIDSLHQYFEEALSPDTWALPDSVETP